MNAATITLRRWPHRVSARVRGLVLTGLLTGLLTGAAHATAPLDHAGRWLTDASGRVVVLHGTNMVYKLPPYDPQAAGFGDSDAAFLAHIGMTAVRVGVIWKAVEPAPGVYDNGYLDHIAATVQTLARHGIVSLLDFHQDMYNETFQGEGAPDWAVLDDGLPNAPQAGFPTNYLVNPALQRAFENFLADKAGPGGIGLQERFAAAWAHVAQRFAADPSVLGYEVLNEPFPGSDFATCASPAGCPASDAELTGLSRKVTQAIRRVDPRHLVFYEPFATFNNGFPDAVGPLQDAHAVFSWHDYCLSDEAAGCSSQATTFANAAAHVAQTGEGSMLTEFGSTTSATDLQGMVALADRFMVPWTEWSYCSCHAPTDTGGEQGMVIDPHQPKTGSNVQPTVVDSLAEPYPHVIAGTPTAWGYDRTSRTLSVAFSTRRASGVGGFPAGSISTLQAPSLDYPAGYHARLSGGAVVSARSAAAMSVASCPGASTVTITVMPGGGAPRNGCRARLHVRVARHRVRAGRITVVRVAVRAAIGRYAFAVRGARVSLAGHAAGTGRAGVAVLRLRLTHRRRAYALVVRASGYRPVRIRLAAL
ncbi:MAG TPA: cellulase family glycosylhydrolase [Solirubrobacteraceae bacterium]|nr:cellulase family glycosylhydrolase [Solirubrobacteraceae bacterium]